MFALALGLACQAQPAPVTPDIPATVTAQFEQHIDSLPTPAPLPTSMPYPTATAYLTTAVATPGQQPTPVLADNDKPPVKGADDLYDFGFGRLVFIHPPGQDPSGIFSPQYPRLILVFPPGKEWEDREVQSVTYVEVKCAEYLVEDEVEFGHKCIIIE